MLNQICAACGSIIVWKKSDKGLIPWCPICSCTKFVEVEV